MTAAVQSAHAAIIAAHPDFAVAVVIQGVSGSGFSVGLNAATDFGAMGETGTISETVLVSAATFPKPKQGETILIGC